MFTARKTLSVVSAPPRRISLYYRHRLPVRLMHWINVLCLVVLFMSGLSIFNAHPALYLGDSSYSRRPAVLEITTVNAIPVNPASQQERGILRIGTHQFDATGILGISKGPNGTLNRHAFPSWITIPGYYSLAYARQWHFFFAWLFVINGLAFLIYAVLSGHLVRDLAPDSTELRGIGTSVKDHLLFRHPQGEAAKRYNVLQKLAYLLVILVLLPLIALMGMAMSPMLDSVITGWVDWVGGRQSARTIHFIIAWLLVAFVLIHVFEVIVSGLWNHLRSMVTGYYDIGPEAAKEAHHENG
ncbi:MAG TPA: cytochrome b/b6 domain-containing protein [Noviherbaspirillum sp.]|uniref:cytochrome b/b6 domain-containing protein n=1 Tax=Noviherbaspirillum sp. TaxID=1926288 RepID=UPI002B48F218|nr:cytochrome b/b6 domain-containing protein [Noviherbaspirillum sp.]HJV84169.1 cytochrome b/b6 domain-containing protein [Noviherbaspirillum sp.]